MHLRSLLILFVVCLKLHSVNGENVHWMPETTLDVKKINDVDVSPDGEEVVYTVTETKSDNAFISQIWRGKVDDLESHAPLTSGEISSSSPRWSPNGQSLAFLSNQTGVQNLFLISLADKEAIQLTDLRNGVETFHWSPDGNKIAFIAKSEKEFDHLVASGLSEEVISYPKNQKISQLFVIQAKPDLQTPIRLTTDDYKLVGEGDFHTILDSFDWSPDSTKVAFTYTPEVGSDSRWKNSQIAIVDVNSKSIENLPKIAPHQSIPKFSPDGKFLAFLKSDETASYSLTRHITLYSISTKEFRQLQKTPDESPFLVGPSLLGWSNDGESLLYLEPLRTKFAIWNIPIGGGEMEQMDDGHWTFSNPLLSSNRKWLGLPLETSEVAPEAYVTSSSNFSPIKSSRVNEHLKQWKMAQTKVMSWKSSDGTEIEGLVTYPRDYQPGCHYPLLLIVHGGPMGFFFENYLGGNGIYPLAAFADAGFVLLRANPRGSCGYGRDFRHANLSDWGGNDFQDLMSGVDSLIAQGIADANRMGVMGWSFGGYMTAWMISQTNRFSAASMGGGICNLSSFAGTTDIQRFLSDYLEGEIWENPTIHLQRSPLFYTHQIDTPLLIQHGENDLRVPSSQAVEFYHALKKAQKPVSLAIYPRSTHRILEPKLQLDAMERNFQWFVENVRDKKQ